VDSRGTRASKGSRVFVDSKDGRVGRVFRESVAFRGTKAGRVSKA
jgi:hypothetical protein